MAKLFYIRLLAVVVLAACVNHGQCTWWNPHAWRDYWKEWVQDSHEKSLFDKVTVVVPESQQPLQKNGINVCSFKVPVTVSRHCVTVPGRRRLKCRFKRYYVTNYECCPGFAREKGKPGCPQELYVSKQNIIDVAKGLGLNQFVKLLTLSGVGSELMLDTPYTAFIPNNEAFEAMQTDVMDALVKDPVKLGDALLFHVLPGKVVAKQLKNNQLLKTMDAPHKIRANVDDEKDVYVVHGGMIVTRNQGASNGIVHVIDKVIQPVTVGSLRDYLKGNPKFSILNRLLRSVNMELTNVTIFAPPDEAFQALSADRLERLFSNKECVQKLVKYHILAKPAYSQMLESARHDTLNGNFLDVVIKDNGRTLTVNDAMVTARDITTDDAIVHVIDKVLLPVGAMELIEAVKALNLTILASMLEKSSLMNKLQAGDANFTLFAPTDAAFNALPAEALREIMANPEKLDQTLLYHMIGRKVWTYEFGRDTFINTQSNMRLRLNTFQFGKVHAANGACLEKANLGTCSGVIHVIGKVLVAPQHTVYDVLNSKPQFSMLVRIIQSSNLVPFLTNLNGSITFFAPTNKALEQLQKTSPRIYDSLEENLKEATRFLQSHLVNRTLYSCGLKCMYSYWSLFGRRFSTFSMSREVVRLRAAWNGKVYVNGIHMDPTDMAASNGVIHETNQVINSNRLGLRSRDNRGRAFHIGVFSNFWVKP